MSQTDEGIVKEGTVINKQYGEIGFGVGVPSTAYTARDDKGDFFAFGWDYIAQGKTYPLTGDRVKVTLKGGEDGILAPLDLGLFRSKDGTLESKTVDMRSVLKWNILQRSKRFRRRLVWDFIKSIPAA